MIVTINPSKISGTVNAPASKSSMQRACAAALLHKGETTLINPGNCNDDLAALEVIQHLGATLILQGDNLVITSSGVNPVSGTINCGESGLGLRMFTPIAALSTSRITLKGTGSLLKRPMDFFDEIFPLLGIEIQSNGGKLPITIKGPLKPANITIDGSLSSQFLTGLLMAFSYACTEPVFINVVGLKSKPYIDLTLQVMKYFGYDIIHTNYEVFHFSPINTPISPSIHYTVEGDWSGAAFLLVAGAISGEVKVKGLDIESAQADKKVLEALRSSGAILSVHENEILVSGGVLKAFQFDATDCPDLFPPLVALAACCSGKSVIQGVSRLTHKESNRAVTLQEEFGKLGINIQLQDDLMIITGGIIGQGRVHSRHDHRIAMACAVAGLAANGPVIIEEAEAISKSYPDFYDHLQKLNTSLQKS